MCKTMNSLNDSISELTTRNSIYFTISAYRSNTLTVTHIIEGYRQFYN